MPIFITIGAVCKCVFILSSSTVDENLPDDPNSTAITAYICLRIHLADPLALDGSLFAFILCFFTEKRFYAAVFAFNVATPTARTPRPPRAPLCGKLHAELQTTEGVVEW